MIKNIYQEKGTVFSIEVFPPKNDNDFSLIYNTLDELKSLNLDFISITYGAGGSTSKRTMEIASYIQNKCNIKALAHLTCVSLDDNLLNQFLKELKDNNINNVLALRGDRPKDMSDSVYHNRPYKYASELVSIIRKNSGTCIAGACYPEIHSESKNQEVDLYYLKSKVEVGTDFLITQLFFDNEKFLKFYELVRNAGISIPLSAGIMPLTSVNQVKTIIELSGANIPENLRVIINKYENDPESFKKAGLEYATNQISDLINHGVQGIHLYTLNKADVTTKIFENLGML